MWYIIAFVTGMVASYLLNNFVRFVNHLDKQYDKKAKELENIYHEDQN